MQKHVGEGLPDAQRLPSTRHKAKPHLEFVYGDGTSVIVNELLQNKTREIGDEEIFHRAGDVEIETDAIVFYARACSHIVDPRKMRPGKISLRCGNAAYKWRGFAPSNGEKTRCDEPEASIGTSQNRHCGTRFAAPSPFRLRGYCELATGPRSCLRTGPILQQE